MDNKKVYTIQINGIQESTNAVEALIKTLNGLEERVKELESKNIKIGTSSKVGDNTSSLKEEIALQKELNQLKKEEAAQQRLSADEYANSMKGMKENLRDLKTVINATDLGDTDKIEKMTKDAGELTKKLKSMEEAYGQFGRNVGNYSSAADGFKKLTIEVNGATRSFDNARQALKTLKNERDTMALNGDRTTQQFKELDETVKRLQSDIRDMSKSSAEMDRLLDTMEGFAAIGTISTGFASLFGINDSEIEKSIQKMVAFQNVLKGIETINKQIQTREGVGAWIAPFTAQVDKATASVLKFNTALLGTGKAANVAAKGIKLASTALKALVSIGIVAIISIVIDKVMDLVESFNKLSAAEEAQKATEESMAKAYGEGMAKITQYKIKLDSFNGSKEEEKRLVEELNKEFGETLGTYKSIAEWQDVMKKKSDLYVQSLVKQAKAQAALNSVTAAYAKLMQVQMGIANGEYDGIWNRIFGKSGEARLVEAEREVEQMTKMLEDAQKELEDFNKNNKLGDYSPQIKKNATKTKNAVEEAQKTLNSLEIRLMNEGLNKKLRQLDEEERQTINKLKENGRKTATEIQKIQKAYVQLRAKEINEYLKNLQTSIEKSAKDIKKIQFEIDTKEIDNQIYELQNKFDEMSQKVPSVNTLTTRLDVKQIYGKTSFDNIEDAQVYNLLKNWAQEKGEYEKYYQLLLDYLKEKNEEVKKAFKDIQLTEGDKQAFSWLSEMFEDEYKVALNIVRSYSYDIKHYTQKQLEENYDILSWSFVNRIQATQAFYETTINDLRENLQQQSKLNEDRIKTQIEQEKQAENERYNIQFDGLQKEKDNLDESIKNFKARNKKEKEALEEMKAKRDEIEKQIQQALDQHMKKMQQITEEGNNTIKKNELDTLNEIKSTTERYYNQQLSNYRDFQSKLNDEISKNPVVSKGWNIVNIKETKKNYKEIMAASKTAIEGIMTDKANLEDDFRKGLISDEAYNATKNQLNDLEKEIKDGMAVTQEASANLIADFISSTQQYIQAALDSLNTIMGAIWDVQDVAFDKEQEQIDKDNEALDKALDKQQEIIEQHKNAIDSIEDELATSRGSRRQHLIDQLNAEMEAQRAALAQEKKIQNEKEANQKKQDELEKKRKKAQYKRDMIQAVVNGAMAVTYAAMNTWPIPAVPLMALAAATTAAQVAIMAANKPYAKGGQLDGGVAQGKRHSEGGIPVLGGRASIEGGEFITNRQTTSKNVDLLEYINNKHRKLNIDDFIDFYSSGSIKKNIASSSPRTKYADGGVIPTLNNEYQFDDRLLTAFEDYSNRPVYVSVVDINNRQEAVRNVQVLAGLGE